MGSWVRDECLHRILLVEQKAVEKVLRVEHNLSRERIFIEFMTSDRKRKAPGEGSR